MTVSCIIPLYNCLALTQAMLASLRATLPAGLAHEIIFVDDGSTDGTRGWLATLTADTTRERSVSEDCAPPQPVRGADRAAPSDRSPPVRVLLNERNAGFAASCNRGAAAATGEFLAFLNNDLVLLPGWIEPMLALARRPDAALVGNVQRHATTGAVDHTGIFFNRQGKPEHFRSRPLASALFPHSLIPFPLSVRRVAALTGACFVIRRAVWQELGAFDEAFINGCEDIDLCLRAAAAGRRNYVALRSVVRHHVSQSPGRKLRDEQNSYRLTLRWRDAIARHAARAWCDAYLEPHWDEPRNYSDHRLAWRAFLYRLRLLPWLPDDVLAGTHLAIQHEIDRWRTMFPDTASVPGVCHVLRDKLPRNQAWSEPAAPGCL
jgi:GT2 family glycosyltransferase